jgi:hypothetical protein
MTRATISFNREGMELIRNAAKREGSSVPQFVRKAALMASDTNPYPIRDLAEQLRAIGDHGYALAEKALTVAEGEADPSADPEHHARAPAATANRTSTRSSVSVVKKHAHLDRRQMQERRPCYVPRVAQKNHAHRGRSHSRFQSRRPCDSFGDIWIRRPPASSDLLRHESNYAERVMAFVSTPTFVFVAKRPVSASKV